MDGLHIQVDAAPEFRLQCVREKVTRIDQFILTHGHADHVVGMDDLRRFCDLRDGVALPVFSTDEGISRILAIYPYAILERAVSKGYAAFHLQLMPEVLEFPEGTIASTLLPHGGVHTLGLVFTERSSGKKLAYYTDCKTVPPAARDLARGADLLLLDGLRPTPHPTHQSIPEALAVVSDIAPRQTYLTHLTHAVAHREESIHLPQGVKFAFDGLRVYL
jgi:phosphoribosyl 1,2-cyclic phosphate phosphodiesterase